ncbi:stage IV sporulation protein A [Sinanaerobacter sp. ZZT-01]|uniref:stage IV sporulation protein A n=1 Tax=Sinanaerobacter sp. ZZT-01 TaxID=3111540 RepID=UPI002D777A0E|nr:stage IV sporulation protein A [Sinanaerobacter sp. ZZT-01]WRR93426.1 stage IV sporulation protein A [Sinanaerobacter sp. ZZT-01]
MENLNIYENIAERSQGDIYIGVVGPVRTGKSTFIKRFMDLMVIPNVTNRYVKERIQDELPQSGGGKTIMTTEPKFVPAEAVALELPGKVNLRVRMVDCVGYLVNNALGHMEDGNPRMVSTPWQPNQIPFKEAAEIGTRKVIRDHSTIGIVVTTDGSIGEIDRESYVPAEERVVSELKELHKPFAMVLNTLQPSDESVLELQKSLEEKYHVPVIAADCAKMSSEAMAHILNETLYEFPATEIRFRLPGFIEGLGNDHWIKATIISNLKEWSKTFDNLKDVKESIASLADGNIIEDVTIKGMELGNGEIEVDMNVADGLYYQVIGEIMECDIENDYQFFSLIKKFSQAKKAYDKLEEAMGQVEDAGYGIVQPKLSEMVLEEPEIFKQGNKFGVRLKAKAPSLHIIKTDITTEVSPVVGSEKQSEDLIRYLLTEFENDPSKIWETNIFGKSLYEMVTEQMEHKLSNVPENIRLKVQRSLQKISDEGKDYFICIVL